MVSEENFGARQQPVECDPPRSEKRMTHLQEKRSYKGYHLLKIRLVDQKKLSGKPDNGCSLLERRLLPSGRGLSQFLFQDGPFILGQVSKPRSSFLQ